MSREYFEMKRCNRKLDPKCVFDRFDVYHIHSKVVRMGKCKPREGCKDFKEQKLQNVNILIILIVVVGD